jgi:hypothetical protein
MNAPSVIRNPTPAARVNEGAGPLHLPPTAAGRVAPLAPVHWRRIMNAPSFTHDAQRAIQLKERAGVLRLLPTAARRTAPMAPRTGDES